MENKKKSLFAINEEQLSILYEIEQMDGELTEDIEQKLMITKNDLEHKSVAYREVILKKEAENILIDTEIKRLTAIKKRNQNIVERLKGTLVIAVNVFGAFTVGLVNFGIRKSQSIEVDNIKSLPKKFKTITVTEKANKTALKIAINEGKKIKGVKLVDNQNLKIT